MAVESGGFVKPRREEACFVSFIEAGVRLKTIRCCISIVKDVMRLQVR